MAIARISHRGAVPVARPAPRLVVPYITAICIAAIGVAVAGWFACPRDPGTLPIMVLVVLGLLGVSIRVALSKAPFSVSFASIVCLAAVPLVGPLGTSIVGFLVYILVPGATRISARLFNGSMTALVSGLGALVYLGVGGQIVSRGLIGTSEILVTVLLPLLAADLVILLLNVFLLAGILRLTQGVRPWDFVVETVTELGWAYLGYGLVGFMFAILWRPVGLGPATALLVLAPLFLVQWTYLQHADERRSHERTVEVLIAAGESWRPYSEGHAQRVADLCSRMAPLLGVRGGAAESLRYAALLHDVGALTWSSEVESRPGPVDESDLLSFVEHPGLGIEMLRDLDFVADGLPAILHHHERFDGRGYPSGLAGEDIPLFARIIAVADAFDSLTGSRSYRTAYELPEAIDILRQRAGTHLDPDVVEALTQVVTPESWTPPVFTEEEVLSRGHSHDHDDPEVSDLYAEWTLGGEVRDER